MAVRVGGGTYVAATALAWALAWCDGSHDTAPELVGWAAELGSGCRGDTRATRGVDDELGLRCRLSDQPVGISSRSIDAVFDSGPGA
jgi:hypothetical protein